MILQDTPHNTQHVYVDGERLAIVGTAPGAAVCFLRRDIADATIHDICKRLDERDGQSFKRKIAMPPKDEE